MASLNIGTFAFPLGLVILFAAGAVSLAVAKIAGRKPRADVEPQLWKVLFAGVFGARLAFVVMYWDAYRAAPFSIIDIRDGGFLASAGILAAVAMAVWCAWRTKDGRKPLAYAVMTGMLVWTVGTAVTLLVHTGKKEVPDLALTRLDGSTARLSAFAGKPIVLNMWATWCPPCRREMPALRDAQRKHPEIVFIFADQGESAETVRAYLDAEQLQLDNVLLDPGRQLAYQTGSQGLPTTLFFDAQGKLVDRRVGGLSAASLAQRLERLGAK
ncbi:TlpA disulfide reductase family protein [Noviherbaspirillum agri]